MLLDSYLHTFYCLFFWNLKNYAQMLWVEWWVDFSSVQGSIFLSFLSSYVCTFIWNHGRSELCTSSAILSVIELSEAGVQLQWIICVLYSFAANRHYIKNHWVLFILILIIKLCLYFICFYYTSNTNSLWKISFEKIRKFKRRGKYSPGI